MGSVGLFLNLLMPIALVIGILSFSEMVHKYSITCLNVSIKSHCFENSLNILEKLQNEYESLSVNISGL